MGLVCWLQVCWCAAGSNLVREGARPVTIIDFDRVEAYSAGADGCDYPLARSLIQFPPALTNEAVVRFALQGQKQNSSFTLQDLQINVEE